MGSMMVGVQTGSHVRMHRAEYGLQANPDSAAAHSAAFHAVFLNVLTSVFNLGPEEVMWASFRLDETLAPLMAVVPETVPCAVRQEMLDRRYTRSTSTLLETQRVLPSAATTQPALQDWVDAFALPIETSYELQPTTVAGLRSSLRALLTELGIGQGARSRMATHLPADLRERLSADR